MWAGSAADPFLERRFRDRVRFFSVVFSLGYSVILLRLFQLQVVKGHDFAIVSESNRTQIISLRAPRGDFLDRKGRILITNRPSWSLLYSAPEASLTTEADVKRILTPFLISTSDRWHRRLQKAFQTKKLVRLAEDISPAIAFGMKEIGDLLPGAQVQMEFRRGYPVGNVASHLTGYLGELDERELKDSFLSGRKMGDLIGKIGLEKILDAELRGEDGGVVVEVDSIGRLKRLIREQPFQKGNSVLLTLDLDVQKAAVEGLAQSPSGRGAAVLIDVKTGAVLAWVSAPSFDPSRSLQEDIVDPFHPFLDRVIKGAYPPGSLFKIVTAIAGLEKESFQTSNRITCVGFVSLKDKQLKEKKFKCWKTHGVVDFWRALAESCDSYFYLLGADVGAQRMAEVAGLFGLGQSVQKILPGENSGTLPHPKWKRKRGLGGWSTGDTYNTSIGQGFMTSTPIQMVAMMAGVATRGQIPEIVMIERIVNNRGENVMERKPAALARSFQFKDSTWEKIWQAMRGVVQGGTGKASDVPYLEVRGKTGTAQNPHGVDHAWFGAFAGYPGESPSVAVCVFVENGGNGSTVAAPIARKMLEQALPRRAEIPI